MLIPIIQIGFASFGISISYVSHTRQVVYELKAITWHKAGFVYNGD